jgi:hypothetical protein
MRDNEQIVNLGNLSLTEEERAFVREDEPWSQDRMMYAVPAFPFGFLKKCLIMLIVLLGAFLVLTVWQLVVIPEKPVAMVGVPVTPQAASPARPRALTLAISQIMVGMRQRPDMNEPIMENLRAGSLVVVLKKRSDGFFRVSHSGRKGYVPSKYLAVTEKVLVIAPVAGRIAEISGKAKLREMPTLSAGIAAGVPSGAAIRILGYTLEGWVLVWNGVRAGFIWGGLLEENPALPFKSSYDGTNRFVQYDDRTLEPD